MHDPEPTPLADLLATADRCDELAEVAELMGDDDGAARLRAQGARHRMRAMEQLDE